jgi:hypothetical protein
MFFDVFVSVLIVHLHVCLFICLFFRLVIIGIITRLLEVVGWFLGVGRVNVGSLHVCT